MHKLVFIWLLIRLNVVITLEDVTSTFYQTKIGLDLSEIETRQVFYHSKDGTKIPMFITAR